MSQEIKENFFRTSPNLTHHLHIISLQWWYFFFLAQMILSPAAHALNLGNQRSSMVCRAGRICVICVLLPPFQNLMWEGV